MKYSWTDVWEQVNTYFIWSMAAIVNAIYIIIWLLAQWIPNQFAIHVAPEGTDEIVLSIFRITFAVSTIIPIWIHIGTEIVILGIRAYKKVSQVANE